MRSTSSSVVITVLAVISEPGLTWRMPSTPENGARTSRSVTVRADFPNDDRRLRPGMLLDVRLFQPARQALVIPEIAVVQVGRESYVFRVKPDSSVERADVRLGERRDGKVEILEGVKPGERIVVDGTGKLRPGLKIDAQAAPANANATATAGKQAVQ